MFFLVLMAVGLGGTVFWIVALIEVAKVPDRAFRAAGTEKTTWLLVVGLAGWIGALIYWFGTRQQLVRIGALGRGADGSAHAGAYGGAYGAPHGPTVPHQPVMTPPGWYQNPEADGMRWWDGRQWTDHVA